MTRATCPHCHNADCPPTGDGEYLCPACGQTFRPGHIRPEEAAERLGVHRLLIAKYLRLGKLDGIKCQNQTKAGLRTMWTWVTEESVNRLRGNHCPICGLESEGGELCQFCRKEQATGKYQWYELNLTPSSSWRAGSLGVYR